MYKKQVHSFKWDYMMNDNENKAENEKKRSSRYHINRPRPRHEHKYTKYKMCLSTMMVICTRLFLSNIWSSIHEKFKQQWGLVEKKDVADKKSV